MGRTWSITVVDNDTSGPGMVREVSTKGGSLAWLLTVQKVLTVLITNK